MEDRIRKYLKEIIDEDGYKVNINDIDIEVINTQNFTLIFNDGNIAVTMSKASNLKDCVRNTLNNYADHHNI